MRDALDAVMTDLCETGEIPADNTPLSAENRSATAEKLGTAPGTARAAVDPKAGRADAEDRARKHAGEGGTGKLPVPTAAAGGAGKTGSSAAEVSEDSPRPTATSAGDKRNVGGRPTAVDVAAKDPKQQRLSFGSTAPSTGKAGADGHSGVNRDGSQRRSALLSPPAATARPKSTPKGKGGDTCSDVPERSADAGGTGGTPELDAAVAAVREG